MLLFVVISSIISGHVMLPGAATLWVKFMQLWKVIVFYVPVDLMVEQGYDRYRSQELRISEREHRMSEYLQVRSNGQITLPADTRRKAKLQESDLLEAVVEEDDSIRLVPKTAVDRVLAEKYQMKDVAWAKKQKKGSMK